MRLPPEEGAKDIGFRASYHVKGQLDDLERPFPSEGQGFNSVLQILLQ